MRHADLLDGIPEMGKPWGLFIAFLLDSSSIPTLADSSDIQASLRPGSDHAEDDPSDKPRLEVAFHRDPHRFLRTSEMKNAFRRMAAIREKQDHQHG